MFNNTASMVACRLQILLLAAVMRCTVEMKLKRDASAMNIHGMRITWTDKVDRYQITKLQLLKFMLCARVY